MSEADDAVRGVQVTQELLENLFQQFEDWVEEQPDGDLASVGGPVHTRPGQGRLSFTYRIGDATFDCALRIKWDFLEEVYRARLIARGEEVATTTVPSEWIEGSFEIPDDFFGALGQLSSETTEDAA